MTCRVFSCDALKAMWYLLCSFLHDAPEPEACLKKSLIEASTRVSNRSINKS